MFQDRLRIPPVLRPIPTGDESPAALRVRMLPRRVRLHSDLPPTAVWTYDGQLPGPTIEVRRGQRLRVEWVNALPARGPYPVTAVTAPDPRRNARRSRSPRISRDAAVGRVNEAVDEPPAVDGRPPARRAHAAAYDGWTENALPRRPDDGGGL